MAWILFENTLMYVPLKYNDWAISQIAEVHFSTLRTKDVGWKSGTASALLESLVPKLFSSGLELASLVVNSNILHQLWTQIEELYKEMETRKNLNDQPTLPLPFCYKISQLSPNCVVMVFITSPPCAASHLQAAGGELIPSSTIKDHFPLFDFLCSEDDQSFSIHKDAITRLASLPDDLSRIAKQIGKSTTLIVTGHSLGGSIASLYTLWLLNNIDTTNMKIPICITFGSPLMGDSGLQQAIFESRTWYSCFLNVASIYDPVPCLFISQHNLNINGSYPQARIYKPFGAYLLCSHSGYACFEDSNSVSELLVSLAPQRAESQQIFDYRSTLQGLKHNNIICQETSLLGELTNDPHRTGIILRIKALGINSTQINDNNTLIAKILRWEENYMKRRKSLSNPSKKLNDMKVYMALLEWYKKYAKDNGIGYYDSYKMMEGWSRRDMDVEMYKTSLTNYWKNEVEWAKRKPQKEGSSFRKRWLFAGTNYRRMVEPLDIAEFYRENGRVKDYLTQGRSEHYMYLEQWQRDESKPLRSHNNANEQKMACSLTEDSCFWAHVENAIILCKSIEDANVSSGNADAQSWQGLVEFEHYVMNLIKGYSVSPEIFLKRSSFMKWWDDYKAIRGCSYSSEFTDYDNLLRLL
ncbi:EDS1, EP domain [Dillenia turbinata]|uniref:EDS1, EP domain n=1 Tax=Dillenia turbinata TaxID=194707 RepID=A0AAN8YUJ5_9MAGN